MRCPSFLPGRLAFGILRPFGLPLFDFVGLVRGGVQLDQPLKGFGNTLVASARFRNRLLATVAAAGRFNGQRTSFWVNAGQETVLQVNKALSVRTRAIEHEEQKKDGRDNRDFIWIGGRQFRRSTVEDELSVSNHRNEAINFVIRRRFSGELLRADGEPKSTLREEGVYPVNKRNELRWTLTLKPGEERKLTYRYTVLVVDGFSSPGTRLRGNQRSVRGQFVAVKRYTFARIRFFRSSSFTSFARA